MSANTFDRIQREIKEDLEREKELRRGYVEANNKVETNNNNEGSCDEKIVEKPVNLDTIVPTNTNANVARKFTQNPSTNNTKGVMHKFIKSRGRLSLNALKNDMNGYREPFEPLKITITKGKPMRKGFVPAEEKMRKELQEFQLREDELRSERRKSQPDLMAALQLEDENEYESIKDEKPLKAAKSMANLCSNSTDDDDRSSSYSSISGSLKPARSLAELCDISDDDVEMPGTYSLIMRFEKMQKQ